MRGDDMLRGDGMLCRTRRPVCALVVALTAAGVAQAIPAAERTAPSISTTPPTAPSPSSHPDIRVVSRSRVGRR
jgi:hypothetical protein